MPKRFAEPVSAPAVGAWETQVKKPGAGDHGGQRAAIPQGLGGWRRRQHKSPVGAFFSGAHGAFESQAGREKTAAATEEGRSNGA